MNDYRGNGLTLITKTNGEFVTLLESGTGMDLSFQIVGKLMGKTSCPVGKKIARKSSLLMTGRAGY